MSTVVASRRSPTGAPGAARIDVLLGLLMLAPIVLHVGAVGVAVLQQGDVALGKKGMVLYAAALAYVGLAVALARRRRYAARFVLLVYSVLIVLASAEVTLRVQRDEQLPWPPLQRVLHPGGNVAGVDELCQFSINDLGVRGEQVALDDVDLRILCVGGSTTECLYVTDDSTWPHLLQEQLQGRLGKRVFVGNAGKSGHFSLNHLYLLEHYKWVDRFEWVVVLCGYNDLSAALSDTYDSRAAGVTKHTLTGPPLVGTYYQRLHLAHLLRAALVGQRPNAVFQDGTGQWLAEKRQHRQQALRAGRITEPPPILTAALARYRSNIKKIIETCRQRGQRIVMVTQPTIYRQDLPGNLQALLYQVSPQGAYSIEVLQEAMNAFNAVLRNTSQELGVDCLDLASVLEKDTSTFYDDCHFNISGCRKVAAALADFIESKFTASDVTLVQRDGKKEVGSN